MVDELRDDSTCSKTWASYSILAGTGFYVIAAILFLIASRRLAQDWED